MSGLWTYTFLELYFHNKSGLAVDEFSVLVRKLLIHCLLRNHEWLSSRGKTKDQIVQNSDIRKTALKFSSVVIFFSLYYLSADFYNLL